MPKYKIQIWIRDAFDPYVDYETKSFETENVEPIMYYIAGRLSAMDQVLHKLEIEVIDDE